jgi:hypothetical protein
MIPALNLSADKIRYLQDLQDQKKYPDAYRYLRDLANQGIVTATTDKQRSELSTIATWMDRAASINGNDLSFSSEFVRGATRAMGEITGTSISEAQFQAASDSLAKAVIKSVIQVGGIPTAEEIIATDVKTAVEDLHLPDWGWAGTIGDILPTAIGGLGQDFVSLPTTDARAMGEAYAKALAANGYGVGRWITSQLPDPFRGAADLDNLKDDYDQFDKFITNVQTQFQNIKIEYDPLILDLDGDGIQTISKAVGIHFDHDGNQFSETTGWVGKNDGLLVWDRNGNGTIDNGSELFGNSTLLNTGIYAGNGFAALAELDSNRDGKVDAKDTAFQQLRIWKDGDSNAVLADGELLTLDAAGVRSISLRYTNQNFTDTQGNRILQVGTYTRLDGSTSTIDDVWFTADLTRSIAKDSIAISDDIAALPDLAGFGNVRSLHQTMAHDQTGRLKTAVQKLLAEKDITKAHELLQDVLFLWSGSSDYAANSRGSYFPDARKLYTLEAFLGEKFVQGGGGNDPNLVSTRVLLSAYNNLTELLFELPSVFRILTEPVHAASFCFMTQAS